MSIDADDTVAEITPIRSPAQHAVTTARLCHPVVIKLAQLAPDDLRRVDDLIDALITERAQG